MLKPYYSRDIVPPPVNSLAPPAVGSSPVIVKEMPSPNAEDGLRVPQSSLQSIRLPNSVMLQRLPAELRHLSDVQQCAILHLVGEFPCLFNDVPTRTTVLKHNIDVRDAKPIKQHLYRVNPVKRALMKSRVSAAARPKIKFLNFEDYFSR